MKIFLLFTMLYITLNAQNAFSDGKIETHGSKFDNYNSIGGYKDGQVTKNSLSLSKFLTKEELNSKELKKDLPPKNRDK